MQAYRLACHYGDSEEEVHETMKISSSAVFNKLMLFVLKEADHIFLRMLSLDEQTTVTARDVQKSKRLKKVESLLKSFLGNSLHLLGMCDRDPPLLCCHGRTLLLCCIVGMSLLHKACMTLTLWSTLVVFACCCWLCKTNSCYHHGLMPILMPIYIFLSCL